MRILRCKCWQLPPPLDWSIFLQCASPLAISTCAVNEWSGIRQLQAAARENSISCRWYDKPLQPHKLCLCPPKNMTAAAGAPEARRHRDGRGTRVEAAPATRHEDCLALEVILRADRHDAIGCGHPWSPKTCTTVSHYSTPRVQHLNAEGRVTWVRWDCKT